MSLPVRRLISTACYALNPLARLALVGGVFRDSLESIKPQVEHNSQLVVEFDIIIPLYSLDSRMVVFLAAIVLDFPMMQNRRQPTMVE